MVKSKMSLTYKFLTAIDSYFVVPWFEKIPQLSLISCLFNYFSRTFPVRIFDELALKRRA